MPSTRVIIAGGGIAGPVLAMLLKMKGYDPVVYERSEKVTSAGLSLGLQPNGLRVLGLIPGLLDRIPHAPANEIRHYSILPEDTGEISHFESLSVYGVRRPVFQQALADHAIGLGVPILYGHELVSLEQDEEGVQVKFANGKSDRGSFLVGCDGLHSQTRISLFGKEVADFMGLTQVGGVAPIPPSYPLGKEGKPIMNNIFGDGFHYLACPINDTEVVWAITQKEAEAKETWRAMDEDRQRAIREGPFAQLDVYGAGDVIKNSQNIVKYGLYDRPALASWHKGRIVLIGDAAHPTSPNLGQGANQAFEDIYHLVRLLLKHNPDASVPPSTDALERAFAELEEIRIPRTSSLVQKARKMGEIRVVEGVEACKKRNDLIRNLFKGTGIEHVWADAMRHPFEEGHSEI